ncbi:putative quinol monooxygenase [Embleya sp. NBC_00896]|uniref:putative quinol monooxygenase n=1 Tax=Embleya sp. NBC_00896 TaxID=2975961 RepID=UPI00386E8F99|nr:antibiotic biosynthesis monooxygenase [Embleya sp. NBC_00896]
MTNAQRDTHSIYGFLHPKAHRAAELKDMLLALVEPTRREEGSLQYHLHEEADGTLFLYEVWRSKEDLDRHMETPHMKAFAAAFFANRMDYLERDIDGHAGAMLSPYATAE